MFKDYIYNFDSNGLPDGHSRFKCEKKMLNTFQITHKKQSMQVDKVIQKFHGKREVNPTKFDLSLSQLY